MAKNGDGHPDFHFMVNRDKNGINSLEVGGGVRRRRGRRRRSRRKRRRRRRRRREKIIFGEFFSHCYFFSFFALPTAVLLSLLVTPDVS